MSNKPQAGLTLIELSWALLIAASLSGLAAPSMRHWIDQQQIDSMQRNLRDSVALARADALLQRRSTLTCPSSDGQRCNPSSDWSSGWIVFADLNNNLQHDRNEP